MAQGLVLDGGAAARGRGGVGGARPDRAHRGRPLRCSREGDYPKAIAEPGSRLRARPAFRRPGHADARARGDRDALVKSGKIDEGLELIDEATAAAVSGQLDPYSTTLVYCMTISSCQDVGDLRRAAEVDRGRQPLVRPARRDRLPRRLPRSSRRADAHARRSGGGGEGRDRGLRRAARLRALHHRGRLLRDRGRSAAGSGTSPAAEEAYARANELGADPQPGVALLRLAEGSSMPRSRESPTRSRRRTTALKRIRRLPAQVEIAVAARDLKTAEPPPPSSSSWSTRTRSARVALRRSTPPFMSLSAGSRSPRTTRTRAVSRLRLARDDWREVGAPFEARAVTRAARGRIPAAR